MIRPGRRKINPSRYLTVSEVADIMGCHRNTVYNWLYRDGLPHKKNASGYILIRRRDLQDFVDEFYPGLRV